MFSDGGGGGGVWTASTITPGPRAVKTAVDWITNGRKSIRNSFLYPPPFARSSAVDRPHDNSEEEFYTRPADAILPASRAPRPAAALARAHTRGHTDTHLRRVRGVHVRRAVFPQNGPAPYYIRKRARAVQDLNLN